MSDVSYIRQLKFFDPDKHRDAQINIIGVGGIGSFAAIALAKLGVKKIRVWDFDTVEPHNIPSQFLKVDDLGKSKVESLAAIVKELTGTEIEAKNTKWEPGMALDGIVIAAVDSIDTRKLIWNDVKYNPDVALYVDARIGGETVRVISVSPMQDILKHEHYEKTLFKKEDAAELPCVERNVIDIGFSVAAIITRIVRGFLTDGKILEHDIIYSAATLEFNFLRWE